MDKNPCKCHVDDIVKNKQNAYVSNHNKFCIDFLKKIQLWSTNMDIILVWEI